MALALNTLWFLAAVLALWGVSLMWRGFRPRGRVEGKLTCPACRKRVESGLRCGACGFEGEAARDFRTPRNWKMFACGWLPVLGAVGAAYGAEVVQGWAGPTDYDEEWALAPVQAMAIGVVLFGVLLAIWSWRGDRSRGRRRCPKCWYDMSGSALQCPECGHDAKVTKYLYRARRRKSGIIGASVLLVGAYGLWIVPRVSAGGPVAAVPTWVLIAGLPWWPDWMTVEDAGNHDEDWTLQGRVGDEKLWQVERWMLKKRARGVVVGGGRIKGVGRAAHFVDFTEDKELAKAANRAVLRAFVGSSPSERESANEVANLLAFVEGNATQDEIRPHKATLMELLGDSSLDVRSNAAAYLSALGEEANDALPIIIQNLRATVKKRKMLFAFPLAQLAKQSDEARWALMNLLDDADSDTRAVCVLVLGLRGVTNDVVVDRLIELLADPDPAVSEAAANSLCRAQLLPEITLPAIWSWMERDGLSSDRIPYGLYRFGGRLGPYMPRLGRMLEHPEYQEATLSVLNGLMTMPDRPDFGPVLAGLHRVALSDDEHLSDRAWDIIQKFATRAEPRETAR